MGEAFLAGAPQVCVLSNVFCALQLISESQGHVAHLVNSVSDVLEALQRERGLGRPRVKADLQRAPSRGARPRGCANGECRGPAFSGWVAPVPSSREERVVCHLPLDSDRQAAAVETDFLWAR